MLLYLIVGLFSVAILAIVLGILVNYIISIVITALYFIGLALIIIKVKNLNNSLLKSIHFNLALVLRNENDKLLTKFGLKARPGFLSKWIEFHWANPYGLAIP